MEIVVSFIPIQGVILEVRVGVDVAREPDLVREGPNVVPAGVTEGIVVVDVGARGRCGVPVNAAAVQPKGKDIVDEPNRSADRLQVSPRAGGLISHERVVHHIGVRGG